MLVPSAPGLPASLKQALAEYTPEYGLPVGVAPPPLPDIRHGIEAIEFSLVPATRQQMAECVAKLVIGFNMQQTKDEARMRVEIWMEANGDLPHDLLVKGTKGLLQSYQFGMPKPSNLREVVQADLDARRLQLSRAKMLLEFARTRPADRPYVRESAEVRIKGLRDSFRKFGNVFKAAGYERQLAEREGREVEDWARNVSAEVEPPKEERPPFKPEQSPSAVRCAELAKAKREGNPA